MKQKNFNPNNYNKLNNIRKKVLKDLNKNIDLNNKKILEIGCGSGQLSKVVSNTFYGSYIHSIDIVNSYVETARKNKLKNVNFETKNFYDLVGTYDSIIMMYTLTELLKENNLKATFKEFNKKILEDGYLILIEEFEDDYKETNDLIGLKVMKHLGYKYIKYNEFVDTANACGFEIEFTKIYDNKQKKLGIKGSKLQIFYENKLNEFDNTKKYDSEEIWNSVKEIVISNNGMRTYNKSRMVVLKKKNFSKARLENIKKDRFLYFSKKNIEANLLYYLDLNIKNLEFAFPIKTFPHKDVIEIFDKYNFNFDVSNENEMKLIEKYKKKCFYSDPTDVLKDRKSLRLNIRNTHSHFGKNYDGETYEKYHVHISSPKTEKVRDAIINQLSKLNYNDTKYLNIGGGYEQLSYLEILQFLKKIRNIIPENIKIVIEAGSLWFKNSGFLVGRITNINNVRGVKFVFLNISRELHAKWSKPIYINTNVGNNDYIICGNTCYEKDLFAHVHNTDIKIGNKIYFKNIEPYSFGLNSEFNGIKQVEVIIDE